MRRAHLERALRDKKERCSFLGTNPLKLGIERPIKPTVNLKMEK